MDSKWVLLIVTIYTCVHIYSSHPQCLDFRPPFKTEQKLNFCSQYSEHGCCTGEKDRALAKRHRLLLSHVTDNIRTICSDHLNKVLCLECSPFAAHVFDSESTGKQNPLPGLCGEYCPYFYTACEDIIPLLLKPDIDPLLSPTEWPSPVSQTDFCQSATVGDMDYCYPLVDNDELFNQQLFDTASTVDGCLCLAEFAKDLRNPLSFEAIPDGSGRILVMEQVGVIHVFFKNGRKIEQPFMDITNRVLTSRWAGDERGLLGLTFHPKFEKNGRFYVYFSIKHDGKQKIQVSEFRVSQEDENEVDLNYEKVLLQVHQPYWNHNGGEILFGFDGYLYIFLGDGGGAGDPGNRAQNKSVLLGKVLRVDVDVPEGSGLAYGIPPENPFVNVTGARPEIYATGIRNIWRCDLDPGNAKTGYGRGRIICGDVGQSAFEEINLIKKGANYGWNSREGFSCFKNTTCGKIGEETLPIYAYPHSVGKSVTGGHIYRGCMNPALEGLYIYGDYMVGKLFQLVETEEGPWTGSQIHMCGDDLCFNGLSNKFEKHILSLGEDADGEIYILTTKNPVTSDPLGKIYKLVDPRRRGDPATCATYAIQSSDPDADAVSMATTPGQKLLSLGTLCLLCCHVLREAIHQLL